MHKSNNKRNQDIYKLLYDSEEKFTSKERDILEKNRNFYSFRKYINIILNIINRDSKLSIRVIDWFVTNYSKKNDTTYKIKFNGKETLFNVHNAYKNQLNGYSKLYFDPFCRKRKIQYTFVNEEKKSVTFETSIGQLNFFQWAIKNKIVNYVEENFKIIKKDMNETIQRNKENKSISQTDTSSEKSNSIKNIITNDPDPVICSSDKITNINISPYDNSISKSDS